ncbi:MAG TPA: DUF1206 domain-containing protein [Glaciihabitans sp.]|jgi:hypothetical protein|nr:DUF1206 domain-containing protein [Glaciihabitans sp.]
MSNVLSENTAPVLVISRGDRWLLTAQRINSSRLVRAIARTGLAANGIVHILIGGIAVGVANGYGGHANQAGALEAIAATPGGLLVLYISGFALGGLALWQLTEAAWVSVPERRLRITRRTKAIGKAIGFAGLGFATLYFALGGRGGIDDPDHSVSERLLSSPGGIALLLAVGLTVASIGGGAIFRGIARTFREENTGLAGAVARVVDVLGVIGYVAKGFALMVVGALAVFAVILADPSDAGGLDGALKYLAALPAGSLLLDVVGAGFVAYGLYLLARSVYLRREE